MSLDDAMRRIWTPAIYEQARQSLVLDSMFPKATPEEVAAYEERRRADAVKMEAFLGALRLLLDHHDVSFFGEDGGAFVQCGTQSVDLDRIDEWLADWRDHGRPSS